MVLVFVFWGGAAQAGQLKSHIESFPNWQKLTVPSAQGDLIYPDWMAGTWNVTSTLVDVAAPLAPDLVTPGFESNRRSLNVPVRFVRDASQDLVADRAFNGLNLARAYLCGSVMAVKVDYTSPNRQITLLKGDRTLVSLVTGRATESLQNDEFITTEVFQQLFKGVQPYFNEVESTTAYQALANLAIEADQVTAVYLSPQDPD